MNKVILMGRLTADPQESVGANGTTITRYRLAVDRYKEGTDFISCVCFNKVAEFASKYLKKGLKIAIEGRIQTGSYKKDDGTTVYTTEVIVNNHEFCEKKGDNSDSNSNNSNSNSNYSSEPGTGTVPEGFMNIPDEYEDEGLPFK